MNKLILFSNSKLLLVVQPDGTYRLPLESDEWLHPLVNDLEPSSHSVAEASPDSACAASEFENSEVFRFPGYVAAPIPSCVISQDPIAINHKPSALNPLPIAEVGLRESWTLLPETDYAAAAKGAELLNWNDETRFCSTCGTKLHRATEISKICPKCGREVFPSLWPAIVVLVIKPSPDGDFAEEEALLVHARTLSRPTVLTLVAGFVETGESLEECVRREVKEETDLEIEDIKYVGSQSWPFPHQLMLGFTARYKDGELKFADGELTAGGFFRKDNLPELPTLPSLSRRIINSWAEGKIGFLD